MDIILTGHCSPTHSIHKFFISVNYFIINRVLSTCPSHNRVLKPIILVRQYYVFLDYYHMAMILSCFSWCLSSDSKQILQRDTQNGKPTQWTTTHQTWVSFKSMKATRSRTITIYGSISKTLCNLGDWDWHIHTTIYKIDN